MTIFVFKSFFGAVCLETMFYGSADKSLLNKIPDHTI